MDTAVIIAGAGPTGLMLAGELRLGGVDVIVLERLERPSGESRGLGFTARTLETLDQRGLLPWFGEIETSNVGHFGGIPLDFSVLDGAHFGGKGIPQARTEEMLGDWAMGLGADVRRGWELTGLADDGDGVTVEARSEGGVRRLRASWVVGCDGGRSTVRKAAGFDFPGTAATREMFIADVRDCDIRPRWIGETAPGGMVMAGPLGDGVTRIVVCERDRPPRRRTEPPSFTEVAAGWQSITGEDIRRATPVWVTSFGDASRHVTEYRRGRVLVAGDAAHIHLPAGGQGMNAGIQDSANLGWKLAAEMNRWAPTGLLDSYHTERHAVGARLMVNTQAQGLLFLGGDEVQPLREVMAELMLGEDVRRHLAGMVSGLEIRYDVGPGDHPLLGLRLPPVELVGAAGKTSATDLLHPARGVLLDVADDAGLRLAAAGWAGRVDTVTAAPHEDGADGPLAGADAVLVRPDGYVAWAGTVGQELTAALCRWFGSPDQPSDNHVR
jgi:bifunctional hydroxylase/dehydrase